MTLWMKIRRQYKPGDIIIGLFYIIVQAYYWILCTPLGPLPNSCSAAHTTDLTFDLKCLKFSLLAVLSFLSFRSLLSPPSSSSLLSQLDPSTPGTCRLSAHFTEVKSSFCENYVRFQKLKSPPIPPFPRPRAAFTDYIVALSKGLILHISQIMTRRCVAGDGGLPWSVLGCHWHNSTPHTSSINLTDGLEDVRSRSNSFIFFQAFVNTRSCKVTTPCC